MRKLTVVLFLLVGITALGQVVPKGIIVEPPAPEGLRVEIWVEKPAYAVGEYVRIHFRVNQDAYIYIWDIAPNGVCLIYPNQREMDNYVTAGEHTVPGPGKGDYLRVVPPTGTEYLQIVATKRPVGDIVQFFGGFAPGSTFACSPAGRQAVEQLNRVKDIIAQVVPENERAFDFTSFQVVSETPPQYGTLVVETTPPFAELYIDNVFWGWTPKTLTLVAGWHDILLKKTGYQDWRRRIYLVAGRTRTLQVTLQPAVANQPPVALFTFSPANPFPGQTVTFDASSSYDPDGAITAYRWDFDSDGVVDATGQVVTHSFSSPGVYTVRLTVVDDRGVTDDEVKTVNVVVLNQPPVAQFTVSPTSPAPGEWVRFDASSSYDPDGTITSYQWDFDGDGVMDATGQTAFYSFAAPGVYHVRLVVTDNQGASDDEVKTVVVAAPNQPPVAQFTISPSPAVVGAPVTFNASSSYDPDGFIVEYRWDLNGDGAVDATGQVVSYTYFAPGTYQVTLYVTDNAGATAQSTQTLQVAVPGPAGMPPMDGIPGVYVWGTDTWNITVNGSSSWASPHRFRIELRTDGTFVNVSSAPGPGPAPLGLVPEPAEEGWKVVFEGEVTSNRLTYTFEVRNATSIYFNVKFDVDGDGVMETSPGIVRLRQFMVNPPTNPFVLGIPEGYSGPFVPSINFRLGTPFSYTQTFRFVLWGPNIEDLEGSSI
jgi:PKD repeat protein